MHCLILIIHTCLKSLSGGAIAVIGHSDLYMLGTNFSGNKAESLFNVITNPNCPTGNIGPIFVLFDIYFHKKEPLASGLV